MTAGVGATFWTYFNGQKQKERQTDIYVEIVTQISQHIELAICCLVTLKLIVTCFVHDIPLVLWYNTFELQNRYFSVAQ